MGMMANPRVSRSDIILNFYMNRASNKRGIVVLVFVKQCMLNVVGFLNIFLNFHNLCDGMLIKKGSSRISSYFSTFINS